MVAKAKILDLVNTRIEALKITLLGLDTVRFLIMVSKEEVPETVESLLEDAWKELERANMLITAAMNQIKTSGPEKPPQSGSTELKS